MMRFEFHVNNARFVRLRWP